MSNRDEIQAAFEEIANLHYAEGIKGVACVMIDKDGDIRMVQACNAQQSLLLLGAITVLEDEFLSALRAGKGHKPKAMDA